MNIFASPAPQWQDAGSVLGASAFRLAPVFDASGFWIMPEGETPEGTFKLDVGSGYLIIDSTTPIQQYKLSKLPSGNVVFY